MKSYAEREVFDAHAIALYEEAVKRVAMIGDHWRNELRCHELTRAVWRVCNWQTAGVLAVDGHMHAVEHSWIEIQTSGVPLWRPLRGEAILDVYAPGRLPQVQLIHRHWSIAKDYRRGDYRGDIRLNVIDVLIEEMT